MSSKQHIPTTIEKVSVLMVILALTVSALLVGEKAALEGSLHRGIWPDYTVRSIEVSPSTPETGLPLTITATIENIGFSTAHRTYAELRIDEWNDETWDRAGTRQEVPPLADHAVSILSWTAGDSPALPWLLREGTHRLRVCSAIPSSNREFALTEENDENNCLEKLITILPAAK